MKMQEEIRQHHHNTVTTVRRSRVTKHTLPDLRISNIVADRHVKPSVLSVRCHAMSIGWKPPLHRSAYTTSRHQQLGATLRQPRILPPHSVTENNTGSSLPVLFTAHEKFLNLSRQMKRHLSTVPTHAGTSHSCPLPASRPQPAGDPPAPAVEEQVLQS